MIWLFLTVCFVAGYVGVMLQLHQAEQRRKAREWELFLAGLKKWIK